MEYTIDDWKAELETLKARLDDVHPGASRAKSIVVTKLDEARLWSAEIPSYEHGDYDGF